MAGKNLNLPAVVATPPPIQPGFHSGGAMAANTGASGIGKSTGVSGGLARRIAQRFPAQVGKGSFQRAAFLRRRS